MRTYLSILFIFLGITICNAQSLTVHHNYSVKAYVYATDTFETKPYPLEGATITAYCIEDSTFNITEYTDVRGRFWLPIRVTKKLKDTRLRLSVSYLGMQPYDVIIDPQPTKTEWGNTVLDIPYDSIIVQSKPISINEIQVIAELRKMYEKGDTVFFNAGAVEMPTGSVLLDLVRRLPGLQYDGTKLTYNGRSIEEIRLNGDKFFSHDMSIALKNMPSSKLKYLKVYDVSNDTVNVNSQKHLVMDMITDKPYKTVEFANAEASGAYKPAEYGINADFNRYRQGGAQITVRGVHQTYDKIFIAEHTKRSYISATYMDFQHNNLGFGPYYNITHRDDRSTSVQERFLGDYSQFTLGESYSSSRQKQFNTTMPFQMSIKMKNGIKWDTNLNIIHNDNQNQSTSMSESFTANPFVSGRSGEMLPDSELATLRQYTSKQKSTNMQRDTRAIWRNTLSKRIGTKDDAGMELLLTTDQSRNTMFNQSEVTYHQAGTPSLSLDRMIVTPGETYNAELTAHYNHRFGSAHHWGVEYALNFDNDHQKTQYYDIIGTQDNQNITQVDSLSYRSHNTMLANKIGANITMGWKAISLTAVASLQPLNQKIKASRYNGQNDDNNYSSILYASSLTARMNSISHTATIGYAYNEQMPMSMLMMNMIDYTDPQNIRKSSSNLRKIDRHTISAGYKYKTDLDMQSSLSFINHQTSTLMVYDRTTGRSVSTPVNINGSWSWNSNAHIYMTILKQSFDLELRHSLVHAPQYVNITGSSEYTKTHTNYNELGAMLNKSFSNKTFMLFTRTSYVMQLLDGSMGQASNTQGCFNTNIRLTYNLPAYLVFNSAVTYQKRHGYRMQALNRSYTMLNLSLSHQFLKERNAKVTLEWNDVLNQSRETSAIVDSNQWTETKNFGNMNYLILSFAYKFNIMK